tara:strand:- start:758 stop:1111 length:354 start_codon:yes stop_codon:yes gene_type:complete
MRTVDDKASRIIEREILANQDSLVRHMLESDRGHEVGYAWENVSNLFEDEDQDEFKEVYQWFLVSDWLHEKLDKICEPVLDTDFGKYWGRTMCGQAIVLDGTFQTIVKLIDDSLRLH